MQAIARQTQHAGQVTLTLSSTHGDQHKARRAYLRIAGFLARLRETAEQLDPVQRWYRILSEALKKRRGRHVGRPPKLTPHKIDHARRLIAEGKETQAGVALLLGGGVATLGRALNGPVDQRKASGLCTGRKSRLARLSYGKFCCFAPPQLAVNSAGRDQGKNQRASQEAFNRLRRACTYRTVEALRRGIGRRPDHEIPTLAARDEEARCQHGGCHPGEVAR